MSTSFEDGRTLPQLITEMTGEIGALVRKELELAKVETKQEVTNAAKAGGLFGGVAVTGHMALLFISLAVAWGLAAALPRGVAFLIVGVLYAVAAAVLFVAARKRAQQVNPVPEQTVETLKEDVEWLKAQRS
jgi:uncharacterized membrane protein YqjE